MRFNILNNLFRTKVDSDAVTSDGYEVTNLVSPNFRERSKGFLAANFVNTPVQLLFQFPFAINVEKVIINPRVGSQISSGFEILVAGVHNQRHKTNYNFVNSSGIKRKSTTVHAIRKKQTHVSSKQAVKHINEETNREECTIVSNPYPSVDYDSLHAYECEITCVSAKTEHRNHFVSVAHVFTDAGTPFVICNNRFCERQPKQSVHMESTKPGKDVYNFRNMHKLQVVTHLIVRIIRILGSSVPALKNIEIWGQPVRNCPQETINLITILQKQIDEENKIDFHDHQPENPASKSKNTVSNTIDLNSVDIPQEFIDPITCSIMTMPILLPSGHNVDSSTLEKHVECENGWGRAASDPFTGINFSDSYRPLPNSSLKVRIDRFLLLSNLNVQNLGRTVGRDTSTVNTDHNNDIQKNGYRLDAPILQGQKGSVDDFHKTLHADDVVIVTKADSGKKSDNKLGTKSRPFCVDHESEVSQSLDVALTNALQGMQAFTRLAEPSALASKRNYSQPIESQTVDASTSTLINTMPFQTRTRGVSNYSTLTALQDSSKLRMETCPGCKRNMQDQVIFSLPCKHVLCRPCLLTHGKEKTLSCIVCKQQFLKRDVVRVYTAYM